MLSNYLPYILPSKIFNALKIEIEYKTSVQMIAGILTFPLFYSLEIWLFRNYINDENGFTLILLLMFLISGYITMYYWAEIKRFSRVVKFHFFMKPGKIIEILKLRDELLKNMLEARKSMNLD